MGFGLPAKSTHFPSSLFKQSLPLKARTPFTHPTPVFQSLKSDSETDQFQGLTPHPRHPPPPSLLLLVSIVSCMSSTGVGEAPLRGQAPRKDRKGGPQTSTCMGMRLSIPLGGTSLFSSNASNPYTSMYPHPLQPLYRMERTRKVWSLKGHSSRLIMV